MIELRWVEREVTTETGWDAHIERVLQYREREMVVTEGRVVPYSDWSDWTDVPVVTEDA